jgi:heme-degrading monooxygenase HmoA
MDVKAGREEEFQEAWQSIAAEVKRAPGSIRQALLRDPERPNRFVLTSDWESREAFSRFERSPEQDALTAPLRGLREAAHMTIHDLVYHVEGT